QFYYLNWGKIFRPEDIYAGNLLSAIEAVDAGVTTTVDWSHGLQTVDYADAAVDALEAVPGRFVLAYGNLLGAPWEWTKAPEFAGFIRRRIDGRGDMLRMQIAFDLTGYPAPWLVRRRTVPFARSRDTSVWWSAGLFSAMRATLNADRAREHMEAHKRNETVMLSHLRAEQVVTWATLGGAEALGMDSFIGSITPGKKADLVLIKNDQSPVMFPLLHPYGHVVFQGGRGDVHTVTVDGMVVKSDHR